MKKSKEFEGSLLKTEERNPLSEDIDAKSSLEIVEIINREDMRVAQAVSQARASIATAMDWITESFLRGGRLFYFGAGTSGRLGVLDASECPPTFGVEKDQVQAVIAGGRRAITSAVEGVEDKKETGQRDVQNVDLRPNDVLVGISAASTTPYVRGAIEEARRIGAKTVLITSNPLEERGDFVDLVITAITGPEVLTGSTRMKAGTATKMILNMLTTGAMIRSGRTYGNLMVDLYCTNQKLIRRGKRILMQVTGMDEAEASHLLKEARFEVKTALAMKALQVSYQDAKSLLEENQGFLRRLFRKPHKKNPNIDAVIFDMDGTILQYELPNGFSTWAALGWSLKIYEEMQEWVEDYLQKKMDYQDIWKKCAQRIRGESFSPLRSVFFPASDEPPYSRGFPECAHVLREHYRVGIVSSGLTFVAQEIRRKLNLDFEVSNDLHLKDGTFNGDVTVRVHFNHKKDVIESLAKEMNVSLDRICFIGDSKNDIETLEAVGLPIAYQPRSEEVKKAARGNIIGDFLQLPAIIENYRP